MIFQPKARQATPFPAPSLFLLHPLTDTLAGAPDSDSDPGRSQSPWPWAGWVPFSLNIYTASTHTHIHITHTISNSETDVSYQSLSFSLVCKRQDTHSSPFPSPSVVPSWKASLSPCQFTFFHHYSFSALQLSLFPSYVETSTPKTSSLDHL